MPNRQHQKSTKNGMLVFWSLAGQRFPRRDTLLYRGDISARSTAAPTPSFDVAAPMISVQTDDISR